MENYKAINKQLIEQNCEMRILLGEERKQQSILCTQLLEERTLRVEVENKLKIEQNWRHQMEKKLPRLHISMFHTIMRELNPQINCEQLFQDYIPNTKYDMEIESPKCTIDIVNENRISRVIQRFSQVNLENRRSTISSRRSSSRFNSIIGTPISPCQKAYRRSSNFINHQSSNEDLENTDKSIKRDIDDSEEIDSDKQIYESPLMPLENIYEQDYEETSENKNKFEERIQLATNSGHKPSPLRDVTNCKSPVNVTRRRYKPIQDIVNVSINKSSSFGSMPLLRCEPVQRCNHVDESNFQLIFPKEPTDLNFTCTDECAKENSEEINYGDLTMAHILSSTPYSPRSHSNKSSADCNRLGANRFELDIFTPKQKYENLNREDGQMKSLTRPKRSCAPKNLMERSLIVKLRNESGRDLRSKRSK